MFLQRCFYLSIFCFSFFHLFPALASGAQANFSWLPNTEANLAGYKIHYGTFSTNYTNVIDVGLSEPVDGRVYAVVEGLNEGDTYYFAATAYDSDGYESGFTQEVSYTVVSGESSLPPVAYDLSVNGTEDTPLTGQFSVDNSGGLPLQYAITSAPSHGTLTVEDATGSFTFTPVSDFNGTDGFIFTAINDNGESNPASVTITINTVNDPPVAHPASFTTQEDTIASGQLTADDPDGDTLTYTMTTSPSHGTASVNSNGSFNYTPDESNLGKDSFSFTVNDGNVDSTPATVSIIIIRVNEAPIALNSSITVDTEATTSGQLSATDPEGETLTFLLNSSPSQGTVTINTDGSFIYTPDKNGSGNDSFSFQANDGVHTSNIATVSITINPADNPLRFEIGELQVSSDWQVVHFETSFINPVVVVNASSLNDVEPGVVRVMNVTADGFEVRFQEWDYLDDSHPEEIITFLVMEQGHFTLDDGSRVEAGCFSISGASSFSTVSFNQTMAVPPVIQTSVTTFNEEDTVTTRIRNVSTSDFEFMMREQEINNGAHGSETACYIAWEPSRGQLAGMNYEVATTDDVVTHNTYLMNYNQQFTETPMVLTSMQSTDGGDTANTRISENTVTGLKLFISEEQSKNSETNHTTETVGYIAIGSDESLEDPDNDGLTTEQEINIYKTNPDLADTDNDGLDDGEEVNYWQDRGIDWAGDLDNDGLSNILDQDADGDGMADGAEIAGGYDPADPASFRTLPIMEAGEVDVDHNWIHVDFSKPFALPVVIAKLISRNDSEPCLVRIDSVSSTGFDLRLQEYDYLDDIHPVEQVSFIVVEAGHYTLADGTQLEAGTSTIQATSGYDQISFTGQFSTIPVVVSSIGSENEQDGVTTRNRKIDTTGFECKLQEQELTKENHIPETVNYLAWEPSTGVTDGFRYEVATTGDRVTHKATTVEFSSSFSQTPLVVTDMQTTDGGDTSSLRTLQASSLNLQVMVEEEQSKDSETRHTTEDAGFIAILSE